MIKIFRGGRGCDTFKTPSPYEQLFPLPTPYFKMFLERSLNDPPPPHFKHLSLLPPPHPPPLPPLKILIIHLERFAMVSVIIGSAERSLLRVSRRTYKIFRNLNLPVLASDLHQSTRSGTGSVEAIFQMNTYMPQNSQTEVKLVLKQFKLDLKFRSHTHL